jgi:hypothetical protein
VDQLLADPSSAALIQQLNPGFTPPARPFKRLAYVDAIAWLNEHDIKRPAEDAEGKTIVGADGKPQMVAHEVGDDIAEAAERQMTDILGVPIFLHGFPAELKAFYMKKSPADAHGRIFTESCDLLMPGVGEIVGAFSIYAGDGPILTEEQVGPCVSRIWTSSSLRTSGKASTPRPTTGSRTSANTGRANTADTAWASRFVFVDGYGRMLNCSPAFPGVACEPIHCAVRNLLPV